MTSTSSNEKSQEETAPAPSEIEKLEAAQEKLKEAMGELEEALRAPCVTLSRRLLRGALEL